MKLVLIALAASAVAAPAFAQDQAAAPAGGPSPAMQAAMGKVREQCAADMQTYCASATDRASRMQCMRDNAAKMSDGCKAAMQAMMSARSGG